MQPVETRLAQTAKKVPHNKEIRQIISAKVQEKTRPDFINLMRLENIENPHEINEKAAWHY
jgi:hypothetical protein